MKEALSFIFTGGVLINVINFIIYYKKKEKTTPDKILLLIFLLLIFVCNNYYADLHGFDYLILATFIPNEMSEWIISPLLYLYVFSLIRGTKGLKRLFLKFSIIPLAVLFFITIPFVLYLLEPDWGLPHIQFLFNHPYLYVFASGVYNFAILGSCLYLISTALRMQKHYYSVNRASEYKWIQLFISALIVVFIVDVSTEIYELFIQELSWDTSNLTIALLILFLTYLAYFGTHHSKILLPGFVWDEITLPPKTFEHDLEAEKSLVDAMQKQQLFMSPQLTLSELAQHIGMTDKNLSKLLNKQLKTNFYEFINESRLQHFEQLALSPQLKNKTIFGLAQESGFRSKATFNRLFKKKHGMTPNQFIKKHQQ